MRAMTLVAILLVVCPFYTFGAEAGKVSLATVEGLTIPGGTIKTSIELVNDTGRPARFRVTARVRTTGKKSSSRGAKVRYSLPLQAGEARSLEIGLPVPQGPMGSVLVEAKVRWPNGRHVFSESAIAFPEADEADVGGILDQIEDAIELTGRVTLRRSELPTDLKLVTEDGDVWWLEGPEALILAGLMIEAGLEEEMATITGLVVAPLCAGPSQTDSPEPMCPGADGNFLWVLRFKAEGVDDPREREIPLRQYLGGPLSTIVEPREIVIRCQSDWDSLLLAAGIRLPERWEVDFTRETILAVFAGEKPSTGYEVQVLRATEQEDGTVLVAYEVSKPSRHEVVIDVPTQPLAIVSISQTDKEIRFSRSGSIGEPGPIAMPIGGLR